jgi:hypothetical protein
MSSVVVQAADATYDSGYSAGFNAGYQAGFEAGSRSGSPISFVQGPPPNLAAPANGEAGNAAAGGNIVRPKPKLAVGKVHGSQAASPSNRPSSSPTRSMASNRQAGSSRPRSPNPPSSCRSPPVASQRSEPLRSFRPSPASSPGTFEHEVGTSSVQTYAHIGSNRYRGHGDTSTDASWRHNLSPDLISRDA